MSRAEAVASRARSSSCCGGGAGLRRERVVAVAPLSTLGSEDKSATTKKILGQIEQAVASLGDKVIPAAQVTAAIDKAKKPQLKACEGDEACLGELGKLVGAKVVISGEVGGLGDSKVIYLGATDVATAKEMRSTTLTLTAKEGAGTDNGGAQGAAIQLLDPDKYSGTLQLRGRRSRREGLDQRRLRSRSGPTARSTCRSGPRRCA